MKVIRYSQSFKLQLVREVEEGKQSAHAIGHKYGIGTTGTVMRWVRQYGSGKYGKVIRVEKPEEINEKSRLRKELRRLKEAVADLHLELAMEKSFLEIACEELNQSVDAFKKKRDGGRRTKR